MNQDPTYKCAYVACICPKCRKEITLKVYVKQSAPRIDFIQLPEEEQDGEKD